MAKDSDIDQRMARVEAIIEQLETDEVSLEEGQQLYDEGQTLLADLRGRLREGDGEVIEFE